MERTQFRKIDQSYQCIVAGEVFGTWQLQCRLQIFFPHPEQQTVIISDVHFAANSFIPYRAGDLAAQVVQEFGLDPVALVWIEQYSDRETRPTIADFNRVSFRWFAGAAIATDWEAITCQQAQTLAGEPLQPQASPLCARST